MKEEGFDIFEDESDHLELRKIMKLSFAELVQICLSSPDCSDEGLKAAMNTYPDKKMLVKLCFTAKISQAGKDCLKVYNCLDLYDVFKMLYTFESQVKNGDNLESLFHALKDRDDMKAWIVKELISDPRYRVSSVRIANLKERTKDEETEFNIDQIVKTVDIFDCDLVLEENLESVIRSKQKNKASDKSDVSAAFSMLTLPTIQTSQIGFSSSQHVSTTAN